MAMLEPVVEGFKTELFKFDAFLRFDEDLLLSNVAVVGALNPSFVVDEPLGVVTLPVR